MRRILGPLVVALLVLAGLTAAVPSTAASLGTHRASSVVPLPGTYVGTDARGHVVSFTYAEHLGQVLHFEAVVAGVSTVTHAPVSDGRVPTSCDETGKHAICFKLAWTSSGAVTGAWGTIGDLKFAFTADLHSPPWPSGGDHFGLDASRHRVVLIYQPREVTDFSLPSKRYAINHRMLVSGRNHHFSGCGSEICVQGHWQVHGLAVGAWRLNNDAADPVWHYWFALHRSQHPRLRVSPGSVPSP